MSDKDHMWRQFCHLGEMMGDGLHHEPDGKWITKEYKRLAKILLPETKQFDAERRKVKAQKINEQMQKLLQLKKCTCGGELKQGRVGSKVAYCQSCNQRYVAKPKKNK